jgi:transglutaminase-like putative cysteine protease
LAPGPVGDAPAVRGAGDQDSVQIKLGYELKYLCHQPTPMLLMLNIHHSRASDIVRPDRLSTSPTVPLTAYRDGFGNWCTRLLAPVGEITISNDSLVNDSGLPDVQAWDAVQHNVEDLPPDTLQFLLGSRYCETDRLSDIAWGLFGGAPRGWGRVAAICEFVHGHITFGYQYARATRTAFEGFEERVGVCRDFAHLAVALCRCMNIPARYCTGYLGDIGVPLSPDPMDFSGWFEAYLGGQWYAFDARHNAPRIGRVLIGTGRDAADVAISNSFGPTILTGFTVWTDEVT